MSQPAGIACVLGGSGFLGSHVADHLSDVGYRVRVFDRSAVIAVAVDARRRRFPQETPYRYVPFAGLEDDFRFSEETWERVIRDYNVKDLAI